MKLGLLVILTMLTILLANSGCSEWYDADDENPDYGNCENTNMGHEEAITEEQSLAWYGVFIAQVSSYDQNIAWTLDANGLQGGEMPLWLISNMGNPGSQQGGGVIYIPTGSGGAVKYDPMGNIVYNGGDPTAEDISCLPYIGLSQAMFSIYPQEDETFKFYGHASDQDSGICGEFDPAARTLSMRFQNGGLYRNTEVLDDIAYQDPMVWDFYPIEDFDPSAPDDAAFLAMIEDIANTIVSADCSGLTELHDLTYLGDL